MNYLFMILRLVVAAVFGGIIGFERSENNHAAGLRTHILLCLGAAAIMVVSECMVLKFGIEQEILRMGAQIISGVGFLGAGSIIIDGGNNKIRGITTAAGLWTTACLGIVVGCGYYLIAATMVVIMLVTMLGLRSFAEKIKGKSLAYKIKVVAHDINVRKVIKTLSDRRISIKSINVDIMGDMDVCLAEINVPNEEVQEGELYDLLSYIQGRIEIIHL